MAKKVCRNDYPAYRVAAPVNGINRRVWNAGNGDALPHGNVDGIFTGPVDPATGMPTHPNPATAQNVEPNWAISTGDFPNDGSDQMELWAWVHVPEPVLIRDVNANSGERAEVWIGECGGGPALAQATTVDTVGGSPGNSVLASHLLPAGVHLIYLRMSDISAWMGFDLQSTTDLTGATGWALHPADATWTTRPEIECVVVDGCDPLPVGYDLCYPTLCAPPAPPAPVLVVDTLPLYEYRDLWAEENATLSNNNPEWSFGAGADGYIGLPIDAGWEVVAMYFHADGATNNADATVNLINIATNPSATAPTVATITMTDNGSGQTNNGWVFQDMLAAPALVPAGAVLGFRTGAVSGRIGNARVGARLRRQVGNYVSSVSLT